MIEDKVMTERDFDEIKNTAIGKAICKAIDAALDDLLDVMDAHCNLINNDKK